jgi:radical SAM superfamily enzyme YgiQ (UPF0313 family)
MKKTKEKICLIVPPATFLLDERVFPHLGILKVAANLEVNGYEVDFLDLSGIENFLDMVKIYSGGDCNVFGITATTSQIPFAAKVCREIKKIKPDSKVILGGAHCTLMNSAAKTEQKKGLLSGNRATKDTEKLLEIFDILVCGDGEDAIFEALKIEKGIIDANDAKSDLFLTNGRLDELPFPARHLVDLSSYKYNLEGHHATSLIAQLGCPFMCTFCSGRNSPFLRRIRKRSSESVLKEIELLHKKYNYTGFMFQDDELNVNKQMVELMHMIADYQEKEGVEFRLRGFIKSELFNDSQAEAMVRAGFKWLLTGFESGDERILHNIRKKATREDNSRCMEIAKKHGLKVKALMSIGHAGETAQSVENTKNWLLQVEPEDFDCTIITTYPGSPYFDNAVWEKDHYVYTDPKNGDKLHQAPLDYLTQVDYYKGDPNDGYISYVWTDHLAAPEIVELRRNLEEDVRQKLDIPWYTARTMPSNEHSMGMGNIKIPEHILKSSAPGLNPNKNF